MVSLAPSHINIFALGTDSALYWKYNISDNPRTEAWTGWVKNDVPTNGPKKWLYEPITVSRILHQISVFLVGDDHSLYHSNFDLVNFGDLGPWNNLGGKPIGPPALAMREAGIIHIFLVSKDGAIRHKSWDGAVYSPEDEFEKLDGQFTGSPAAVSTGRDDVSVFAVGLDNSLYHYQWKSSSGWSPIQKLPGHWVVSSKAVSDQLGSIDVFGIDGGGNILHVFRRNGKDWKLETLRGSFTAIDGKSLSPGSIDIFALHKNKTIFHRTLKDDLWLAWEDLTGIMHYPPTVVSNHADVLGVVCVNESGIIFYKVRDVKTGAWTEWNNVGGTVISRVG